jgi:hypothetical protein
MSDVSVIDVQNALRGHAERGHDVLSHPGGVVIKNVKYPMAFGHALELDHPGMPSRIHSIIPLNESGNALHVISSRNHWDKLALHPTIHTPFSGAVRPGRGVDDDKQSSHWAYMHPSGADDYKSLSDYYRVSGMNTNEFYKHAQSFPARLDTLTEEGIVDLPLSEMKRHNPAEATWDSLVKHTLWSRPDMPHGLDSRNLGKIVLVGHHPSQTSHLYIPDTEQLIKL